MNRTGSENECSGGTGGSAEGRRWRIERIEDAPPDVRAMAKRFRRENVANGFSGPMPIKLDHQDYTFRAVGNRLYFKKKSRTYADFLLDLIKYAFGPTWHKAQVALPEAQRHVVMQWMGSWYRHCTKVRPKDLPTDAICATAPTGDGQSLMTLADDLYRLQLAQALTSRLMRRLRAPAEFQGARYEIQVASIFLRSGFEIEWNDDVTDRHCEFYAVHRHSRQRVAVEAKSRKRPGVLGKRGDVFEYPSFRN